MKKLAFLLVALVFLASSCKKSYNCTCTVSTTFNNVTTTSKSVMVIPDATQQEAATICVANEAYQQGGTQSTHCSL